MPSASKSLHSNRILTAMTVDDYSALHSHLEPVDLPLKTVLVERDEVIEWVHFLGSGIGSVVAISSDGEQIEVGHIGLEGLSGMGICLGVPVGSTKTVMQAPGNSHRIRTGTLERILEERPMAKALLDRYVYAVQVQLAYSALSNARYSLRERLARWLLMCHDRIDGNDIGLTHELLSSMLGVRRASITVELQNFEASSLIKGSRGNVRILNRERLKEIAGGCYGYPEAVYDRLIGSIGKLKLLSSGD